MNGGITVWDRSGPRPKIRGHVYTERSIKGYVTRVEAKPPRKIVPRAVIALSALATAMIGRRRSSERGR